MNEDKITEQFRQGLQEKMLDIAAPASRRIFVKVGPEDLLAACGILRKDLGFTHLSTISGLDAGTGFEMLYHFADADACVTLRVMLPRECPEVETITPVFPGAILYERELQDLLGIVVKNIPDPRPLVLPDDWPAGNYPLRKDWTFTRPEEKIPGEKK